MEARSPSRRSETWEWQSHPKAGIFAQLALDPDVASHQLVITTSTSVRVLPDQALAYRIAWTIAL